MMPQWRIYMSPAQMHKRPFRTILWGILEWLDGMKQITEETDFAIFKDDIFFIATTSFASLS